MIYLWLVFNLTKNENINKGEFQNDEFTDFKCAKP